MIRLLSAALLATAVLFAACGDDDDSPATATPAASTSTTAPATESSPSAAATVAATATTAAPQVVTPRAGGPAPLDVPAGMGSTQADGVFPRTVVHFGGTTEIPAEPKRIVVIATGQLDGVLTLGVVPIAAASALGASFLPDYVSEQFPAFATELGAITDIGVRAEPDLELLASLQPDLILANKAGSEAMYDRFAAIAPTVFTQGTGVNWKQDFLLIAAAMGKTGEAKAFLNDYYLQANAIAAKTAANPVTVSMVRFNTGRTRMFGVASFGGSIAYDAGLERPEAQQFDATSQDLSLEQVNLMDGDYIFYAIQPPEDKTDAGQIIGQTNWNNLAGVKAGHAVAVDDDPWYLNAGPTAAMVVIEGLAAAID